MTKPKPNKGVSALLEDREILLDLNEMETALFNTVFATLRKTNSFLPMSDILDIVSEIKAEVKTRLNIVSQNKDFVS